MKVRAPATRMELMKLRKRYAVAVRGHKMLKDKLDELVRRFLELAERNQGMREKLEKKLTEALAFFLTARASLNPAVLSQVLHFSEYSLALDREEKPVLNLRVPSFSIEETGDILSYGFEDTGILLDAALLRLRELLRDMLMLAEREKSIQLLAEEIEKTRRRVNALEYELIPALEEAVRYIRMKLEERERATLTRLMKVKEIIQAK